MERKRSDRNFILKAELNKKVIVDVASVERSLMNADSCRYVFFIAAPGVVHIALLVFA